MMKINKFLLMSFCILLLTFPSISGTQDKGTGLIGSTIDTYITNPIKTVFNQIGFFLDNVWIGIMIVGFWLVSALYFGLLALIIWLPIKLYPYYLKYQNIISQFIMKTK